MKRREFLAAGAAASLGLASVPQAVAQTELTVEMVHFDPVNPVLGNPNGDVTIVEFFDYQCPWCKKGHPDVMNAVTEDGNVRLLMRDWPIFGESSLYASRMVLAAESFAYRPMLEALFATQGKLSLDQVRTILTEAGHDPRRLESRYEASMASVDGLLARNMAIAEALGFSGTPSFVIGTQLFFGYLDKPAIIEAIKVARGA
jgi:protein-disulfide isomerase